jgi:hypothetical protein
VAYDLISIPDKSCERFADYITFGQINSIFDNGKYGVKNFKIHQEAREKKIELFEKKSIYFKKKPSISEKNI